MIHELEVQELDESDLDAFHYTLINFTAFLMCDKYSQRFR